MAKTKHNNILDSVDSIFTDAKEKGVMHLYMDDEQFDGRFINIDGAKLRYFGTTSYMGFDQEIRLKEAASNAIWKYGTQFPLSKAYMSQALNKELESLLHQMYGHPVIVGKNSTLIHLGVIPSIVRDEDAVILDHQVHHSVQNACNLLKIRGIPVEVIRHNRLDILEEKIKELRSKHTKIWYMIDGIYSMYGDSAPLKGIEKLLNQYPQLNVYIDDVHGMSWTGKNGTGFVLSEIPLHNKMVLISTLGKSFGASGALMTSADHELVRYVKTFGSALTFSAQLEPASLAAAIASAKIHLSDEINNMQAELADKIAYCNHLLSQTNLPLYISNNSPLFYIGTGLPNAGFNLSKRLLKDGYYVNVGIFPAVPVKNTGLRFSISRHNHKEDIKGLIDTISFHYDLMLADEGKTHNDVRKAFKMPLLEDIQSNKAKSNNLRIQHYNHIKQIGSDLWNTYMSDDGAYDYNALEVLEKSFSNHENSDYNWLFHYFVVTDNQNKIVLVTFFVESKYKEDMFAPGSKSVQIEKIREKDPSFLISKALCMGTYITEGSHLYLDKTNPLWTDAFKLLFKELEAIQEAENIDVVILRDFESDQTEEFNLFSDNGFVKVHMPESCIIDGLSQWNSPQDFLQTLNKNNRDHLKSDVLRLENQFTVEIKSAVSETEADLFYDLYMNVKQRNFDINTYAYPKELIKEMSGKKSFEYIVLYDKNSEAGEKKVVSVIFCYINHNRDYIPLFIGMDYNKLETLHAYKQSLYQIVLRAKAVGAEKIFLGFSATIEKRKLGATAIQKFAFVQNKDNYAGEYIETMIIK